MGERYDSTKGKSVDRGGKGVTSATYKSLIINIMNWNEVTY